MDAPHGFVGKSALSATISGFSLFIIKEFSFSINLYHEEGVVIFFENGQAPQKEENFEEEPCLLG